MKIAFVGKGGSGKTTLSTLFIKYLSENSTKVYAIDADINQHLAGSLGLTESVPELGNNIGKIKEYINPTEKYISRSDMIKTITPNRESQLIQLDQSNELLDFFALRHENISLMNVGSFQEKDLGTRCFHSKTGALELFFNHLVDTKDEVIVTDMTAGADSFASGLFTRFDLTVIVVEPTQKSLDVYQQYKEYAYKYNVTIKVVGNKIYDQDDLNFLEQYIDAQDFIGALGHSRFVRNAERGQMQPITELESENQEVLEKVYQMLVVLEKDWGQYYEQMKYFHIKNGESWANSQMGICTEDQIDQTYDYIQAVQGLL